MKRLLFIIVIIIGLINISRAQVPGIYDGFPADSFITRLNADTTSTLIGDTSITPLWQIGTTHKSFFTGDSSGTAAMMTDTVNYYPVNANNSFIIKIPLGFNTIVDFWHKYQTDNLHAGGIVEFSLDTGLTWQNIKGDCNHDSAWYMAGILTSGCYTFADTLFNGSPAFTGVSSGLQYSRIQFFNGLPVKMTTESGCEFYSTVAYLRFRFVSDSTVDSLAGWMIDSIKVEHDIYEGAVAKVNKPQSLHIYPNPSTDGSFNFPVIENEQTYKIEVYNSLGSCVFIMPYSHTLQLGNYPKGLYLYRATNGIDSYSGQLLVE